MAKKKEKEIASEKLNLTSNEVILSLRDSINKHYNTPVMSIASERELRKLKTGLLSFDIESEGGVPRGRGIILVGDKSTFKSTLLYIIGGKCQHICGNCLSGMVKERNYKKVNIVLNGKENAFVAINKENEYFSKGYFADSKKRNLFCPGEKIPLKIVKKKKLSVYAYDIECERCNNPNYSVFVLIDGEHNYTKSWARRFGVISHYVILAEPLYSEQAGDILRETLGYGRVTFLGIDSLDALGPKEEDVNSIEDWQMGLQARIWNKIVRSIHSYLNRFFTYNYTTKEGVAVSEIFQPEPLIGVISQYREKIGVMFGSNKASGGGRGKDFLSSLTIELSAGKVEWLKDKIRGEEITVGAKGRVFNFNFIKSKVSKPHRSGKIYFDFENLEINNEQSVLDYGLKYGFIEQTGAWYSIGEQKFQGEKKVLETLKKDKNLYNNIVKQIYAKAL